MTSPTQDVIALSRFRAEIARAHRQRAEVLLADPNAKALVPKLSVQDLYYAIRELGITDAHDLLAMASVEQVQGFLDLDAWARDHMLPERIAPWLNALTELGPVHLGRVINRLEKEIIHLYLLKRTRIYDLTMEESPDDNAPDDDERPLWPTPDGHYIVEFLASGDEAAADQRLIDSLYRYDLELAQQVLMGAKFDLESDLEETAYRFRSARLADLGYVPFEEALAIYKPVAIEPDAAVVEPDAPPVHPIDGIALPPVLLRTLDERLFVVRVLGEERDPPTLETLEGQLLLLLNQALAADSIDPTELHRIEPIFLRTLGYLSLGLEHLGQRSTTNALAAWKKRGTVHVFRVGFSLVRKLANLGRTLVAEGRVRLPGSDAILLDDPWRATIEELLKPRPLYAASLDDATGPGGAAAGGRPFRTLGEVGRLTQLIAEAALWPRLILDGFGLSLDEIATLGKNFGGGAISFATILRTQVARLLADLPLAPKEPLPTAALQKLATGALPADAESRLAMVLQNALAERGLPELPLARWLTAVLQDLPARLANGEGLLIQLVK